MSDGEFCLCPKCLQNPCNCEEEDEPIPKWLEGRGDDAVMAWEYGIPLSGPI